MAISRSQPNRRRRDRRPQEPLCAYRLVWLMVMFDLPVDSAEDRKGATDFRNKLLDFGFERCQYSVYLRFCEGREQADRWVKRVREVLPQGGKVYCLCFTDKQYAGIVRFEQRAQTISPKNPGQFVLF